MYLVTVEDKEDGVWWDEPAGFDALEDAKRYADEILPPEGHEAVIWRCYRCTPPSTTG